MKCLSLKQPFAELVVSGRKTIELRNWNTRFRGEFLVHASLKPDGEACEAFGYDPAVVTKGAIVGKAILFGVKKYVHRKDFDEDSDKHLASGKYLNSRFGFLLKDAIMFDKPVPLKGMLGFFDARL